MNTTTPAPLVYTVPDACRLTTLSRATLYRHRREGLLRFTKAGRRTVIMPVDLQAYLDRLHAA